MSAPLDLPYGGRRILGTTVDGQLVYATLSSADIDGPEENAPWRQPLGLRSRPLDRAADALVYQDGDYPEVLLAWAPGLSLGGIDQGDTQLYSTGRAPQWIEVSDGHIYLGNNPTDFVMLGDTYRAGENTMNTGISTALGTMQLLLNLGMPIPAVAPPSPAAAAAQAGLFAGLYPGIYNALAGVKVFMVAWLNLIQSFEGAGATYLSKLVKTQ